MRLIVLDRSPYGNDADARSDALLAATARGQGIDAEVREFVDGRGLTVASIDARDAVLVRADLRSDADLVAVTDAVWSLERRGVTCFPSAEGLVAAEDKFRTFVRMRKAGVPTVSTVAIVPGAEWTSAYVAMQETLQAFPRVVKRPVGWGGRSVTRCDDAAALARALGDEARERPEGVALVQPYVAHDRAITVLVAGGSVVSAWASRPAPGEFRSNTTLGGTVEPAELSPDVRAAALGAVAACDLVFGSVEFLDDGTDRPPVVEVNAMPGLWPDDPDDRAFAEAIVACVLE